MTMNVRLVELYEKVQALHAEAYSTLESLKGGLSASSDMKAHADAAYALRETAKYADDIRKMCIAQQETCEKIACAVAIKLEHMGPIKTDHCTASTKIKMIASVPRPSTQPEEFAALMEYFGIKNNTQELFRLHWPTFVDHLSDCLSEGKPLPPGIDPNKTYPEYRLVIHKKKGVNE